MALHHLQEKRNVEALKSSPYVNPGSKRTPYAQQHAAAASYIISPYRCGQSCCCCAAGCRMLFSAAVLQADDTCLGHACLPYESCIVLRFCTAPAIALTTLCLPLGALLHTPGCQQIIQAAGDTCSLHAITQSTCHAAPCCVHSCRDNDAEAPGRSLSHAETDRHTASFCILLICCAPHSVLALLQGRRCGDAGPQPQAHPRVAVQPNTFQNTPSPACCCYRVPHCCVLQGR